VLNADVHLDELIINDEPLGDGTYSSASHPEWFEGTGSFIVGTGVGVSDFDNRENVSVIDDVIFFSGAASNVRVYSITGAEMLSARDTKCVNLKTLHNGIYIISFQIGRHKGMLKHIIRHK
jgi:hypothetical protein